MPLSLRLNQFFDSPWGRRPQEESAKPTPASHFADLPYRSPDTLVHRPSFSSSVSSAGSGSIASTPAPGARSSSLRSPNALSALASASTGDLRLRLPRPSDAPSVPPKPALPLAASAPPRPVLQRATRPARPQRDDSLMTIFDDEEHGHPAPTTKPAAPLRPQAASGPVAGQMGLYGSPMRAPSDAGQSSLASSLYRSGSDASTTWSERPGHRRSLPRPPGAVQQDFFLPLLQLTELQRATLLISLGDAIFVACRRTYQRGMSQLVAERLQSRWREDIPQTSQASIYAVATRVQSQPGGLGRLARFVRWALGRMTPEPALVEARVQGVEALASDELAGLLMPCALSSAQMDLLHKHCQPSGSISSMGSVSLSLRSPPPSSWSHAAL